MSEVAGYAAIGCDRLFAYGETRLQCREALFAQISGADARMKRSLLSQIKLVPLDADQASEVAECIAAEATEWF